MLRALRRIRRPSPSKAFSRYCSWFSRLNWERGSGARKQRVESVHHLRSPTNYKSVIHGKRLFLRSQVQLGHCFLPEVARVRLSLFVRIALHASFVFSDLGG